MRGEGRTHFDVGLVSWEAGTEILEVVGRVGLVPGP